MRTYHFTKLVQFISSTALCCATLAGCGGSADDSVQALSSVSRIGNALSVGTPQTLLGTYGANCVTHNEDDPWAMALDNVTVVANALSVVKNNSACRLNVTGINIKDGSNAVNQFDAAAPFELDTNFQSAAIEFSFMTDSFFANAKIDDYSFDNPFVITMNYSQDPTGGTGGGSAQYTSVSDSVALSGIPVPDYTFSIGSLAYAVDAGHLLLSDAVGSILLAPSSIAGDKYMLLSTNPGSTQADYDAAWDNVANTQVTVGAGGNIALRGKEDLALLQSYDIDTSKVWYVLIANWLPADTTTRSFQKLTLTFSAP